MENEKQFYTISKQLWDKVDYPVERYTSVKKVRLKIKNYKQIQLSRYNN